MISDERERLVQFFDGGRCWCQHAEARDAEGNAVRYDDPAAVAWDLTGALCRLFGWSRATTLFGQLERHIEPGAGRGRFQRDDVVDPMRTLQQFNDDNDMNFNRLSECLLSVPLWRGPARSVEAPAGN